MACQHKGCKKSAAKGKYFCNKHLHGQRTSNPVSGTGGSYGKGRKKKGK